MALDELEFVKDMGQIRQALVYFNMQAASHRDRVYNLMRQTQYWVYDAKMDKFAPNKFVAYKNMTFERYENALYGAFVGAAHDGHAARRVIEKILAPYNGDAALASKLIKWADLLFPPSPMLGISEQKWRFVFLPRYTRK